MLSFIKVIVHD